MKQKELISKLLRENFNKQSKDKEIFSYKKVTNTVWNQKVKEAMNFQKINFDLENNESTGEKKILSVTKDLRKGQPVKYKIAAELFEAGGDWEFPVMYFKLEFISTYGSLLHKNKDNPELIWDKEVDYSSQPTDWYIIIPPKEVNKLNDKCESDNYDLCAYTVDEISKEEEKELYIDDKDRKAAWKWLEELLTKLIDKNHKMLD
jgi:hypothetical protein